MKSKVYKYGGKMFRYDHDNCVVEWVVKASEEMLADNKEWMKKFKKRLWDIDADGYVVMETEGLQPWNWTDKAERNVYLDDFIYEMRSEWESIENDIIQCVGA